MRHHLDPARRTPSLQLGAAGPVRVSAEDADPSYVPPPFLGFAQHTVSLIDPRLQREVADLRSPEPALWQDEGDQA